MRNIPFANFEERLLFTLLAFMGLSTSPFSWGCQYQPTEEPSSSDSTFSVPDPDESEDTPTTQDITRPQR